MLHVRQPLPAGVSDNAGQRRCLRRTREEGGDEGRVWVAHTHGALLVPCGMAGAYQIMAGEGGLTMIRGLVVLCALTSALISSAAHSETDMFMRAVGFALTGSDDADPRVIANRANCVFAIKNDVYHLNNVYYDRTRFKGWQRQSSYGLEKSITVELHGDDVVFEEETTKPVWGLDPASIQRLQVVRPDFFQSHHYTYRQLRFDTGDMDRVKRAWQYIYSHGCTGKRSPF